MNPEQFAAALDDACAVDDTVEIEGVPAEMSTFSLAVPPPLSRCDYNFEEPLKRRPLAVPKMRTFVRVEGNKWRRTA